MRREDGALQSKINAVEMVRGIREAHYEKVKDLSTKDKITFFREQARALHAELGIPKKLPPASEPEEDLRR